MNQKNQTDKKDKNLQEKRKNQILEAALSCFIKKGYYETTMDDIVNKSSLSKGTLYWYFKSKEEVLEAVVKYWLDKMTVEIEQMLNSIQDSSQIFVKFEDYLTGLLENLSTSSSMMGEYISHAFRKNEIRKQITNYYAKLMNQMEFFFHAGIKEGKFKKFNVKNVVQQISAVIEGMLLIWMIAPDLIDPLIIWKLNTKMILNEIKK